MGFLENMFIASVAAELASDSKCKKCSKNNNKKHNEEFSIRINLETVVEAIVTVVGSALLLLGTIYFTSFIL